MCKINKKQNAHGVTVRSLWILGQGCIQERRLFQIYSKWFKQIQTRLQTLSSSRPPALSLGLPPLSFSIWDSRRWWKVISLNGILRKLLLGISVIPARGNEQMCSPVSQEKDNCFHPAWDWSQLVCEDQHTPSLLHFRASHLFLGWDAAGKLQFIY